jgi:tRNA pseudouridine38-40 synthase
LSTKKIRLVVAYDGTDFCGWAAQAGRRSVQCTLKRAVRQVSGEDCEIIGASRTDGGAHARGQVCHFTTAVDIPPEHWAYCLNRALSLDLRVVRSDAVRKDFHSRFSAIDRSYRYRILIGRQDPFRLRFAHYHWKEVDFDAMRAAATKLVGVHDFKSFSEEVLPDANTFREVFAIDLRRVGPEIWIDIRGNAFLRGMIRRIAGGLLEVGQDKRPVRDIDALLIREQGVFLPVVLPARGLTLMKIRYGRHPVLHATYVPPDCE